MLAQSEKLRREMGAYNREKAVRQFALEKMLATYQRLFRKRDDGMILVTIGTKA